MNYLDETPFWPNIAKLDYPPKLKKILKAGEDAWARWAEADTERIVKEQALEHASTDHIAKVKNAARTGGAVPELLDTRAFEDASAYATEVCVMRRHEISLAVVEIQEEFREHRVELAHLALAKAEKGMAEFRESIRTMSEQVLAIEERRKEAYDGLVMLSDYSAPEITYVPAIDAIGEVRLPSTHESGVQTVMGNVRTMLALIEAEGDLELVPTSLSDESQGG